MTLQPFGPRHCNDSGLWHLSLSVCLEGGGGWWEGVREEKRRKTVERKSSAPSLLITKLQTHLLLHFLHGTWKHEHDYSSSIHVLWLCRLWALRWSFFKYSIVKHSLDESLISHGSPGEACTVSSKWQDWLSRFSLLSLTFGCLFCFVTLTTKIALKRHAFMYSIYLDISVENTPLKITTCMPGW